MHLGGFLLADFWFNYRTVCAKNSENTEICDKIKNKKQKTKKQRWQTWTSSETQTSWGGNLQNQTLQYIVVPGRQIDFIFLMFMKDPVYVKRQ